MGREVGGGFKLGNRYTPMADSCQCMTKPIQYCKVKNQINKTEKTKTKTKTKTKSKKIDLTEEEGILPDGIWT